MLRKNRLDKVCIIRSNPVRPDSRVEKEAWSLKQAGYDVQILAWDRATDERETKDFISVAGTEIPITRLGHKASYGEGFKNIKAYISFQLHMRKWLKRNDFDVIHACDFDTAFFSQGIARRKRKKFVFDIFDFLFGNPRNFMQKCVKKAQLEIINRADATIICTEERKKQISGSNPKKLAVIHNTPFLAQVSNTSFEIKETDKIKIAYVGILQDYRLLKEIAEAISTSDYLELHIGGFGKYEKYFTELSEQFDNIHFYGRLPYEKALSLEKNCDIMLAVYDPSIENHRFAAPNKFYESLMLGKPVVMVRNTGMSQVVEDNEVGVLIDYSKDGFADGIQRLIAQKEKWHDMGERMKAIHQQNYCWEEMENRLIDLYIGL